MSSSAPSPRSGEYQYGIRSPIAPIQRPSKLTVGAETPTAAEIGSETAVYTFVLPSDWTTQEIGVGAGLQPSLGGGPLAVKPCETEVCVQNDSMAINHIPLPSQYRPLKYSPRLPRKINR